MQSNFYSTQAMGIEDRMNRLLHTEHFLMTLTPVNSSGVFFLKFIIIKMVKQCGIFYIF